MSLPHQDWEPIIFRSNKQQNTKKINPISKNANVESIRKESAGKNRKTN
jgi:hypothetical protein